MKNVLVTGATGLLGSHIAMQLLHEGWRVKCFVRTIDRKVETERIFMHYGDQAMALFQKIEWVEGDILEISTLLQHIQPDDYVVHSAAWVSFLPHEYKKMFKINVEGTANVVNACLEKKVAKLCHISSVAAIGRSMDENNYSEDTTWKDNETNTQYAISKYKAELEVWRGSVEGLNMVIVNPATIIGPGNWEKSSASLINKVWKGNNYYTSGINGFVDVRDVANISIKLMERSISDERFIACGENIPFQELFNLIADNLGKPRPTIEAKPWVAQIVWRIGWLGYMVFGKVPFITKESARTAMFKSRFSNEKVKKALNYSFIPLSASITHACECFLRDKGVKSTS
jgi:nucleoside-diphosphate-sugar epimerase